MKDHQQKNTKNQSRAMAHRSPKTQGQNATGPVDNRPQSLQMKQMQSLADQSLGKEKDAPLQKKENRTGLPDSLKSGVENLSGFAMDDVKVHYNSQKPAQLNAHAYAQGTDIHVAPGQEKHLPHEAWHVVQQKQGRVNATRQMKGKVGINDDAGLEKEADTMGRKALNGGGETVQPRRKGASGGRGTVQRMKPTGKNAEHDKKVNELNAIIAKANAEIAKINHIKETFKTDSTSTPMNPAVYHESLAHTDHLHQTKEEAQFANFSMQVKQHLNSTVKSGNITPEVQTAYVTDALKTAHYIYVSGNNERGNKKIRPKAPTTLGDFYVNTIRPLSVVDRQKAFISQAKTITKTKKAKTEFAKKIIPPAAFLTKVGLKKDDPEWRKMVVKQLHKGGKRSDQRKRAQSARKFGKKYGAHEMRVPGNDKDFHAESVILKTIRDVGLVIQQVGGTKVACLACQTFFTHLGEQALLGDHAGYAWISQASIDQLKQLIATINDATDYLVQIQDKLQARLASMRFYTGKGGEKKLDEMSEESDIDETDSEDEDAMQGADINDKNIVAIAEELYRMHFPGK